MQPQNRFNSPEAVISPTLSDSPSRTRPTTPTRDLVKSVEKNPVITPSKTPPQLDLASTSPLPARTSPTTSTRSASPVTKSPTSMNSSTINTVKVQIPEGGRTIQGHSGQAGTSDEPPSATKRTVGTDVIYKPRKRRIERLTVRQLGEATPDVMHPFFTKKAGFNLEEALPQYVHEYATLPVEEIMKALVRLYSRQLRIGRE